jgi:hypothetical protein
MSFNQRQMNIKDVSSKLGGTVASLSIFNDNRAVFLIKKTEKLCTALYLVTDHLRDSEPLKPKVRKSALNVLENISALGVGVDSVENSLRAASQMRLLEALIVILGRSGLISSVNAELVRSQCEMMSSIISDIFSEPVQNNNTDSGEMRLERRSEKNLGDQFFKDSSADILLSTYFGSQDAGRVTKDAANFQPPASGGSVVQTSPALQTASGDYAGSGQQGGRREAIISIIKSAGRVNIKDVAARIPGCSEKTVQRDLNALIAERMVERIGKKRWSLYTLTGAG